MPATPDLVFTLKKPTRYELPKAVQNMIMCSLKQVPMIRKGQVRTTHQPNGWSAAAFIEGIFGVVA